MYYKKFRDFDRIQDQRIKEAAPFINETEQKKKELEEKIQRDQENYSK
jgi:hypothetical protein